MFFHPFSPVFVGFPVVGHHVLIEYILQVLVSGDESGKINIWCLASQCLQILKCIEPPNCGGGNLRGQIFSQPSNVQQEFPVTTLSLWNKIGKGTGCPLN